MQHQHAHCEDVLIATALLTTFLSPYRVPLYERLAQRHEVEVLCYGGAERYVPPWFADLDSQLAAARFPARRLGGLREALALGRRYSTVIAPFAGGALLPAAYAGTKCFGRPFVLWASVWVEPRSAAHAFARPAIRHIYRRADAVLAYGEHVRRFVATIRGRDADVFVAPQAVEPELFARHVAPAEIDAFRRRHQLPGGPLVIYAGRLVEAKGIEVLLSAWRGVSGAATLVVIGDGPLASHVRGVPRTRLLGSLPRAELPIAYAAGQFAVIPSIPTPRFVEPWGLVCNEAMHQARPVIATDTVGAVAGGLVRDRQTGMVVAAGDPGALRRAIDRLLADERLRAQLGGGAQAAVAAYTYDAMVAAFDRALAQAAAHKR
ncbi:MAG: glycosyltransferase family 4 protein [Solirubrobacterales bacterium]|nr:glycosyltransferase family 4 protein [Solirubrobacterales bacterium]